jgi:hypothetical protein
MPNYPQPSSQWLAGVFTQISANLGALNSGGTSYIVDPAIANASKTVPNARVILGNVTVDNFGNNTGLPATGRGKWGIATFNTSSKTWTQL